MAKAILETLEGISEDLKKEYVEKDGRFFLTVTPVDGYELQNIEGLKSTAGKERKAARDAEAKLKTFEGLDPEEARAAIKKLQEIIDDPKSGKDLEEKINAIKKQMSDAHAEELGLRDARGEKLTAKVRELLVDAVATTAITELKGSPLLLLPHIRRSVKVRELDNGDFVAEVVDKDGNPRIGDSAGNPMDINQLVKEFSEKDEFAPAFDGTGASGGGTPPGGSDGGTPPPKGELDLSNPVETLKAARRTT